VGPASGITSEPGKTQIADKVEGRIRAGCGLFAAAFPASIVGLLAMAIGDSNPSHMLDRLVALPFALPFALIVSVLLGLPAHLMLKWCRIGSIWAYIAAGFAFGLLDLVGRSFSQASMLQALPWCLAGLAAAITFWLIARPDIYKRPPRR
jgi:ABC-type Na+ efflux pump permease subunit